MGASMGEINRYVKDKYIKKKYVDDTSVDHPLVAYKKGTLHTEPVKKTKSQDKVSPPSAAKVNPPKT